MIALLLGLLRPTTVYLCSVVCLLTGQAVLAQQDIDEDAMREQAVRQARDWELSHPKPNTPDVHSLERINLLDRLAQRAIGKGDFEKAINYYYEASLQTPANNAPGPINLAYLKRAANFCTEKVNFMHQIGNTDRISDISFTGIDSYRKLTTLEPDNGVWWYDLACAFVNSHGGRKAEGPLEHCIRTTGGPNNIRLIARQKLDQLLSLLNDPYADDTKWWKNLNMWPVAFGNSEATPAQAVAMTTPIAAGPTGAYLSAQLATKTLSGGGVARALSSPPVRQAAFSGISPPGAPVDFPLTIYPGSRVTNHYGNNKCYSVEFHTTEDVRTLCQYYLNEMQSRGWYINNKFMESSSKSSIGAARAGRSLSFNARTHGDIGMQVVRLDFCVSD